MKTDSYIFFTACMHGVKALNLEEMRERILLLAACTCQSQTSSTAKIVLCTPSILFAQGIKLLHDFWHIKAYRAFEGSIKANTACTVYSLYPPDCGSDENRSQQGITNPKATQNHARRRGDPPETCKALALGGSPLSPIIKPLVK